MSSLDYFHRVVIKFFQKWRKSQKETSGTNNSQMGNSNVPMYLASTSIEKVELALYDDCKQSLRNIADNTGVNRKTVLIVTEDLGMMKVSAKWYLKI